MSNVQINTSPAPAKALRAMHLTKKAVASRYSASGDLGALQVYLSALSAKPPSKRKARASRKGKPGTKELLRQALEAGQTVIASEFAEQHGVSVATIRTHLPDLQNEKYYRTSKADNRGPLVLFRVGKGYKMLPPEQIGEIEGEASENNGES